jgi:hypothetical protein
VKWKVLGNACFFGGALGLSFGRFTEFFVHWLLQAELSTRDMITIDATWAVVGVVIGIWVSFLEAAREAKEQE